MYPGESIDTGDGFPRVQSVLLYCPVSGFVPFQCLQIFYNLVFVATTRLSSQFLIGVSRLVALVWNKLKRRQLPTIRHLESTRLVL